MKSGRVCLAGAALGNLSDTLGIGAMHPFLGK